MGRNRVKKGWGAKSSINQVAELCHREENVDQKSALSDEQQGA
jgi:hypothetical protein